jgi:thiosulfate dehydrogenase [quinone] large subunit
MNRLTIILIVLAALVGLFFGYILGGWLWALIFAVGTAVAAWLVGTQTQTTEVTVEENSVAHFMFKDPRSSVLWLPVRLFLGWEWLDSGWGKIQNPEWFSTGNAIRSYWERVAAVPEPPARPSISYDWWRGFIQGLLDADAHTWFGPLMAVGETLVGLGLILGGLVGIAAFFGILMNTSFLLSGSVSTNPIMLLLGILLILAWKVAGWIGLDRWLLPALGTPWHRGRLLGGTRPPTTPAATPPTSST